jgi:hypothetical protein
MKLKSLVAAMAVAVSAPAMASTCTETFNLGVLGPPAIAGIGNTHDTGSYTDCWNFSVNSWADGVAVTLELFTDITSVSLTGSNPVFTEFSMPDAGTFSFSSLAAGSYTLTVAGTVAGPLGTYLGGIRTVTAAVPEPETYAMLALGLGVVGWASRRRQSV